MIGKDESVHIYIHITRWFPSQDTSIGNRVIGNFQEGDDARLHGPSIGIDHFSTLQMRWQTGMRIGGVMGRGRRRMLMMSGSMT